MSCCGLHGCFFSRKRPQQKSELKGTIPKTTDEIRSRLAAMTEEFEDDCGRWKTTPLDPKLCFANDLLLCESKLEYTKQDRDKAVAVVPNSGV